MIRREYWYKAFDESAILLPVQPFINFWHLAQLLVEKKKKEIHFCLV